jgi:hypothetical protein
MFFTANLDGGNHTMRFGEASGPAAEVAAMIIVPGPARGEEFVAVTVL